MSDERPPDYDAIEQAEWQKNAGLVPGELNRNSERLSERIKLFTTRFGFPSAEIINKIRTDSMFAAHFAKEPRRTGLHEKYAAAWIKDLPMVKDFHVLPKGGSGAVYITSDGNIHQGILHNRPGKSLDFAWKTGEKTCYAMHKYTKQGGGNQDSQHKEMVALMRNFQSCNDRTCVLFIIADGPYYQGTKMDDLRNHARQAPPKSYALSIGELPAMLRIL